MGDVADMIADGSLCESCGSHMKDGDAPGFPRQCEACFGCAVPDYGLTPAPGQSDRPEKEPLTRQAFNRRFSPEVLDENGITFRSLQDGAHLIIVQGRWRFDFWPGTGRWQKRLPGRKRHIDGVGVLNLVREIKRLRVAETVED